MEDNSPVKVDVKCDLTDSAKEATASSCKGVRRIWNLLLGKREAQVAYFQQLTAAQAAVDAKRILLGKCEFQEGQLVPVASQRQEANVFLQTESEQEMLNLADNVKVAIGAMAEIDSEEVSDEEVDNDFFSRWRREAKVIGSEELQNVWGRILAEEVKSPGSISFRTLDVVKNLKREEAELFCKYARVVVDGNSIVCKGGLKLDNRNVSGDILRLVDCGLASSLAGELILSSSRSVQIVGEDREKRLFMFPGYVLISYFDEEKALNFQVSCASLTTAGRELFRIADFEYMQEQDFEYIFSCILKGGDSKLYRLDGDMFEHQNPVYPI